jgi:hypothetical protein
LPDYDQEPVGIAERGELGRSGAEHRQSERVLLTRARRRHIRHGKADLTDPQQVGAAESAHDAAARSARAESRPAPAK